MIKRYNNYKKSSFDFIGEIPTEWNLIPLKLICSISKGKKPIEDYQDYEEGMLPYLSMEFLRNQNANNNTVFVRQDDNSVVFVEDNDLLILWDGSKAGEIVKAKKGALSSTMGKLNLFNTSFNVDYLTYYLKSCENFIQDNTIGMGIPHVDGNLLRSLLIAQPSIAEQFQIARYLDHQTSLIDEIINRKEKQIELLKEKRQAIINEAIAKGLVPNAKMKDSGIDWLGGIPEEWDIVQLKRFVLDHRQGYYSSKDYDDSGFKVARITDIKENNILDISESPYYDLPESEIKEFILKNGDFVFQRTGAHKKIGVYRGNEPAIYGSFLIRFRFDNSKIDPDYLLLYFESLVYQKQLNASIHGGVNPNIHAENIKECLVVLPTKEEQISLKKYLAAHKEQIILIIDKLLQQIEKLKEYRQSIISEAVTGKIDVRDWQPNHNLN